MNSYVLRRFNMAGKKFGREAKLLAIPEVKEMQEDQLSPLAMDSECLLYGVQVTVVLPEGGKFVYPPCKHPTYEAALRIIDNFLMASDDAVAEDMIAEIRYFLRD